MMNEQQSFKSLQILRGIAATSVVYFHTGVTPNFGSFGVDIFFVISGFVMAMVIERGQSTNAFVINRLTRIVPLYWLLTSGLLLFAALKPQLLESTTANFNNYFKSICFIPYFKENGKLHPMLAVGWTLNYEMLFYSCLWLSIISFRRQFYLHITTIVLLLLYFLFGDYSSRTNALQAFFGYSQIFVFVFGMLLFKIHRIALSHNIPSFIAVFIAIASYLFLIKAETTDLGIDRLWTWGLSSFLLVGSMIALEPKLKTMDNKFIRVLSVIGDASYATYLGHLYVVEGIRKVIDLRLKLIDFHTPLGALVTITLSLLVGHIVYLYIDKPVSQFLKKKLLKYENGIRNPP